MVRILGCHLFRSQDVVSTVHEPVCVWCTRDNFFVATHQRFIHIFSLAEQGCPEVHKFPTVSVVRQISYLARANTLVCLEEEHTIKHVRLYNGWETKSDWPMKVRFTGRLSQETSTAYTHTENQTRMVVSEIQLQNSPTSLAVDAVTGALAITVAHRVMIYSPSENVSHYYNTPIYDYHCDFEIDFNFKILNIALCENFIAVVSLYEMQVVSFTHSKKKLSAFSHKSLSGNTNPVDLGEYTEGNSYQKDSASPDQTCDKLKSGMSCITEDKHMLVWTPAQLNAGKDSSGITQSKTQKAVQNIYFKGLHCCKFDRKHKKEDVHKTKDESELQSQLKVKIPQGSSYPPRTIPHVECCLYRNFHASQHQLHSLQFIPVYTRSKHTDENEQDPEKQCQLSSLSVFVSTTREGHLYQVLEEATLLATYPYSNDCHKVMTTSFFIHAITSGGLETYTSKAVPAALHDTYTVDNRTDALPPINPETCLLSLQPFIGVQTGACTEECVILLSMVQEGDWCLVESQWSMYILKMQNTVALYEEMLETGQRYRDLSPHAYIDLLQEIQLLLRSAQFTSIQQDPPLDAAVAQSTMALATEYAGYEVTEWFLALPYFRKSNIPADQIITKVFKDNLCKGPEGSFSRGFLHWLEHALAHREVSPPKCLEINQELLQTPTTMTKNLRLLLQENILVR